MPPRVLTAQVVVACPIDRVFDFFSDVDNLEALTPPFLGFRILTPRPIAMQEGTLIDYRICLHGLPIRWRTRISAWQPPFGFVDEQLSGPYRRWRHEHTFEPTPAGTLCSDRVEYDHWGGPVAERLLVRPNLDRIFAFRRRAMTRLLSLSPDAPIAAGPT